MNHMEDLAKNQAKALTQAITTDPRWNLQDELMCQVFGFTMYGYVFGVGRVVCFMDVEDINKLAIEQLTGLGIGPKYAEGLIQHAQQVLTDEGNTTLHSQLIGTGHSHFASEDTTKLVESVFANTERIRNISSSESE